MVWAGELQSNDGRIEVLTTAPLCGGTIGSISFCAISQKNDWRRSIVIVALVSAGELSLSCARLLAG